MTTRERKYSSWNILEKILLIVVLITITLLAKASDFNSAPGPKLNAGMELAFPIDITAQSAALDWNTASSWDSNSVPTGTDDVYIPSGATITISGTAICQNLIIEPGGTLILDAGASLTVEGDLTNNGSFDAGTGEVILNKSGAVIAGTSTTNFFDLTIGTDYLDLQSDIGINGSVNWSNSKAIQSNSHTVTLTGVSGSEMLFFRDSGGNNFSFYFTNFAPTGSIGVKVAEGEPLANPDSNNYLNHSYEFTSPTDVTFDLVELLPDNTFVLDGLAKTDLQTVYYDAASASWLEFAGGSNTSSNTVFWGAMSLSANTPAQFSVLNTNEVEPVDPPTASLSGDTQICPGNSASLELSLTGSGPWSVVYSDGSQEDTIEDIQTSPYGISVSPSVTTSYTLVSVTDALGQTTSLSQEHTVEVGEPQLANTQSFAVCSGESFQLEPQFDQSGVLFTWSRAEVTGISNAAASGAGPYLAEQLINTTAAPISVVYSLSLTTPSGCSTTMDVPVEVNPSINFSYTVTNEAGTAAQSYCELDWININLDEPEKWNYELDYVDGTYGVIPEFEEETPGHFRFQLFAGIQTLRLTASSTDGSCRTSQDISLKIYSQPDIAISLDCAERSLQMRGEMAGSTANPLNFGSEDIGEIEYSYDGGATWTTVDTAGPGLPFGMVTVYGRNSAFPDCYTTITAEMGLGFVNASDVVICQGVESMGIQAAVMCYDWLESSHIKEIAPDAAQTYIVTGTDYTYSADVEVSYAVSDIFIIEEEDGLLSFNDCSSKKAGFSYSIYEYPFDPSDPDVGFVRFVEAGDACNAAEVDGLELGKYYQIVVNDYDIGSGNTVMIQFNKNNKASFIEAISNDVAWYDEAMNMIANGEEFDPVAAGFIPDTNTPGEWIFYVGCTNSESCKQEVRFIIDASPVTSTDGDLIYCSDEETNIRLSSIDFYNAEPIDPAKITYTWTAQIRDNNPDLSITNTSCNSACGNVIRETVQNTGSTTGYIDFTVIPTSGSCVGETLYFTVQVEPTPQFTLVDENGLLCPDSPGMLLTINSPNGSSISGLSFEWSRDNTGYIPGDIPASGTGDASGFTIEGDLVSLMPNSIQQSTFTVNAMVNGHACATEVAVVEVGDVEAPVISCPENLEVECHEDIPTVATTAADFIALDAVSDLSDNCTSPNDLVLTYTDQVIGDSPCDGYILRTYRATDFAGNYSECSQEIRVSDNTPPSIVSGPDHYFTYCVNWLMEAIHNGLPEPDIDITPERPDYHILTDTEKQALAAISFTDNCSATLYWSLVDEAYNPIASEDGVLLSQRTDELSDHAIRLEGDEQVNKKYMLIYWVSDSCGNVAMDYTIFITVTPRPRIIRMNDPGFSG